MGSNNEFMENLKARPRLNIVLCVVYLNSFSRVLLSVLKLILRLKDQVQEQETKITKIKQLRPLLNSHLT